MWKDPIVEETRSRREELARRFNHDIKAIGDELRRQREASGQKPFQSSTETRQAYRDITHRSSR